MFRQVWIGGKVSASSSWTLDGFSFQFLNFEYIDLGFWFLGVKFQLSVFGRLILVQLSVLGVEYIGSAFVFGRLILVLTFGSWTFVIDFGFQFRLSVLGHLIYRFRLFVLGCLICSSYAFDLKLSVVNCNILGLWIGNGCDISLGFGSVSAVISLGIEMFQLRYLWIWKSAPESQ
ncbi:unnamed protein product [Rhizophagus irregularis]|nr:unnamed protein product [Rhizophagus irregularis]CAB5350448.1 unnamed protein product [Rhizophagus irregularis]